MPLAHAWLQLWRLLDQLRLPNEQPRYVRWLEPDAHVLRQDLLLEQQLVPQRQVAVLQELQVPLLPVLVSACAVSSNIVVCVTLVASMGMLNKGAGHTGLWQCACLCCIHAPCEVSPGPHGQQQISRAELTACNQLGQGCMPCTA